MPYEKRREATLAMIKCCSLALLVLVVLMPPAFAQRDFLTPDEVSKVREAQEPRS